MSRKISTIKLTLLRNANPKGGDMWRIETVTDSVDFNPGDLLDKQKVEELCASREWKVTIGKDNRNA